MEKIARFLVQKRVAITAVMLVLAIVGAILMPMVEINSDMTKYLPDDSSMKIGMDRMEEEFAGMQMPNTIRVMATGLSEEEKLELQKKLSALEYVDSVDFVAGSEDYNRGEHALFVINTLYHYGSAEELSIEKALDHDFSEYSIVYKNGDSVSTLVPTWILVLAVVVATVILCLMSASWVEPFLFLIAIGVAVLLNMGSNVIQGTVSMMTYTISAVLQLALSMDYSIILMNRYRQECAVNPDKQAAMASALYKAFPSIASSSFTTVVSLLALVFMRFKIGLDLGIVLAKGVFLSMICIFTVLPCLILLGDGWIRRTAKKVPHPSLGALATFNHRFRYAVSGFFVLLFVGAYLLQAQTSIAYSLETVDPIAEVFPAKNPIVLLYENDDEETVAEIADKVAGEDKIRDVLGYSTTLGKPYTAKQLSAALRDMGAGDSLDVSLLQTVYYLYHKGNAEEAVPLSEMIRFLAEDVAGSEALSGYLDADSLAMLNDLQKFASEDALTTPLTAAEMAEFLGYDAALTDTVYRIAGVETGALATGKLTLAEFARAAVKQMEEYPEFSSALGGEMQDKLDLLLVFTDAAKVTTPLSFSETAELLGLEPEMMQLVYVLYYAQSEAYTPDGITLTELARFLQEDVQTNPLFADSLDGETAAQLDQLKAFTDPTTLRTPISAEAMAALFGMERAMIEQVFTLYYGSRNAALQSMRLPEFTGFLLNDLLQNEAYAGMIAPEMVAQLEQFHQIVTDSEAGTPYSSAQIAALSGMEQNTIDLLFFYYNLRNGTNAKNMTLPLFFEVALDLAENPLLSSRFDEETLAQLRLISALANAAEAGQLLTSAQLAEMLGMDESLTGTVYRLYHGGKVPNKTMSPEQFVSYLLNDLAKDPLFADYLDASSLEQLATLNALMQGALNGTVYPAGELAELTGMDLETVRMLLTYRDAKQGDAENWVLSVQTIVEFLNRNRDLLAQMGDSEELAQLPLAEKLIQGAVKGTKYSARALAALLGTDARSITMLYALADSSGAAASLRMSVQEMVTYLDSNLLNDPMFSGMLDEETASVLSTARTMIDALLSGEAYSAEELSGLLETLSPENSSVIPDSSMISLLYLYRAGIYEGDPEWKLSIEQLFHFLTEELANDERFSALLGDEFLAGMDDMSQQLQDGLSQMVGKNYSLLMIDTVLPIESDETTAFFALLNEECSKLSGEYYLIGNSAMSVEMAGSFQREMWTITILTAAAIFLVVLFTFRSLLIPTLLVLIVQCGVFLTIAGVGFQGYAIYFLATIVVQCILMGATIDYGILFTNYFRENSQQMSVRDALARAYDGSIHTILTSGTILFVVTGIISVCFEEPTIGQICRTISIGSLCATLLILLILPGLLAATTRWKKAGK